MRRFYVDAPLPPDGEVAIEGDLAHRLTNVLRLRAGDEIALFDGSGDDVSVRIERVHQKALVAAVIERGAGPAEPRVNVHLYQSITKGERFEWLLEKGTEIGVSHFVPLITARAVVKTSGAGNRMDRWRRIVIEAAEQCGRSCVPSISASASFSEALSSAPGLLLLPYEAAGDAAPNIQSALDRDIDALFALGEVSIFIGPEGGYEPGEVEVAAAAGATIVTMGERVLRSETAGLVAATLVLHAAGELG